jgi:cell division septation protein DedD
VHDATLSGPLKRQARWTALTCALALLALLVAAGAGAQEAQTTGQRIHALVTRGDSAAARRLADSLVANSGAVVLDAAEGLYWRGALARSRDSARVDLSRVVVEYSQTATAGDALYRLAMMDLASGDRASARRRLVRAGRDYTTSITTGDAALELATLLIADGSMRDGCAALDSALQHIPAEQVEKRNRVSYMRRPCAQAEAEASADTTVSAGRGVTKAPEAASSGTSGRGARAAAAPATVARWSVQVGAFNTRAEADRAAQRLTTRGYEARVTGERPFRVRIGRYAKRAEASALVAKLKAEKTPAFLVEAERP